MLLVNHHKAQLMIFNQHTHPNPQTQLSHSLVLLVNHHKAQLMIFNQPTQTSHYVNKQSHSLVLLVDHNKTQSVPVAGEQCTVCGHHQARGTTLHCAKGAALLAHLSVITR